MSTAPPPFEAFPKIHRLVREVVITEKLDGTNAQVFVAEDGSVHAGSRNRWITPAKSDDNFGFARWVEEHAEELRELGPGHHYGEWWGAGIQRRYGLDHKRFSLFNVHRWGETRPACCHVVPVLKPAHIQPMFDTATIYDVLLRLEEEGSQAAPGFMNPEGIVVFHTKSHHLYKFTLNGDGHKG